MKKIFWVMTIGLATVACKQTKKEQNKDVETPETNVVDMHAAQNALDWSGDYFGVIPCASCPGINTYIRISDDGTYEKNTQYREEKDGFDTEKGKFTWSDDGSAITLSDESLYRVGEGELVMLDADGQMIKGELAEAYVLKKVILSGEGVYPITYTGDDKKTYTIVYNTTTQIPIVTLQSENQKNTILFQTEAWAKGGVYENKNAQLTSKSKKATLNIDGKKIKLTETK
ncbi:MAG: copper resistance protein NlpE [Capnocytophaga sp.]|nr:copper resistance protein NlpE [Capnocytophaga sp.]